MWYRAACLAITPVAALVQFVDYGNVDTVLFECIVPMVKAFVKSIPFLASHVTLEGGYTCHKSVYLMFRLVLVSRSSLSFVIIF